MPPVPMGAQQVRPQQSFKYTPTARNPPGQECHLFPWELNKSGPSRVSNIHQQPGTLQLRNRSRCWVRDSSLSSRGCSLTWLVRSLACCSRSTTLSWFTCWRTRTPSRERLRRLLLSFKPTRAKLETRSKKEVVRVKNCRTLILGF